MRRLYCLLLLLFAFSATAQIRPAPDLSKYKSTTQKLQAWAKYCDEYLYVEDYKGLRKVARKGLRMVPKSEPGYLSVYNFYIGITFDYGTQTDSAVFYLERAEKWARLSKNNRRIEQALLQLINAYNTFGNSQKKEKVLLELQRRADTIKDERRKGQINDDISTYYTNKGEYEKGLQYQLASIRVRRMNLPSGDHNDSINFGVSLINVAELYLELKNPQKSLEYLNESNHYIMDYQDGIATIYRDFTATFLLLEKPEKAKEYYNRLLAFLNKGAQSSSWSVFVVSDLDFAHYYLKRNDFAKALDYTNHAAKLSRYSDQFQLAKTNHSYAKIYLGQKQYAKALDYLKKAEPIMREDSPKDYSELQKSMSEAYAAIGNWQLAYQHFNTYSNLQDNLLTEKAKDNLAKMEAQFQNKRKQAEIDMLSAENTIKNLEIENAARQRIFLIIGLVLLILVVASLVVIYCNKQKSSLVLEQKNLEMGLLNAKLENANNTKSKLFSIISHDLRSPISHIYQFLDLQKTQPEIFSEADKQRHNERISIAANSVLETMEDLLVWSKSQMQQFSVTPEKVYIRQCLESIIELMQTQLDRQPLSISLEVNREITVKTDRNILTIILRNLLQNAIKYAPKNTSIAISGVASNNAVSISIADQGDGLPEPLKAIFESDLASINSSQSGLGLTLIKEMAALLGANVTVEANNPKGCIFIILIGNLSD
ncbi:MAG TPA: tetratricopeptide repeat-containing sensor histidine kinase [Flavobacterium sp.]|nr:tetratricopeptide repeat-containing sensor histidine kinase [Flavobacterium sp.]HPJ11498.1 tetratricopeptide repeat-containing sensor histidine kinase [Flavobacterium sp.]